jgi:hypothetical protein
MSERDNFRNRDKSVPFWKTAKYLKGANEHGGNNVDHEGNLRKKN